MEYREIKLHESVKLINKDGTYNKKTKASLDYLADTLKERGHTLLSPYGGDRAKMLIDFKCGHDPYPISPNSYKSGGGCYPCGQVKASKMKAESFKNDFIKLVQKNGHELLSPYGETSQEKVLIDFKCGHDPEEKLPTNYFYLNHGCSICGGIRTAKAKTSKSERKFLASLKENGHEALSPFINTREPVLINFKCEHEPSLRKPSEYHQGTRCGECRYKRIAATRTKLHREQFIKLVKSKGHILLSPYINAREPVLIDFKCGHDPREVIPSAYAKAKWSGCQLCANYKLSQQLLKKTGEKFAKLVKKNNHKLLSDYKGDEVKVLINFKCKHKPHWITPHNYKIGNGCGICSLSKGVKEILKWLEKNKIKWETEYFLPKKNWRYDIYIPSEKLIVEVQGIWHFEKHWHENSKSLKQQQATDRKKRNYAEWLGYRYIEVDYREGKPKLALERFLVEFQRIRSSNVSIKHEFDQLSLF